VEAAPQLSFNPPSSNCTFDVANQQGVCNTGLENSSKTLSLTWSDTTVEGVTVQANGQTIAPGSTEPITILIPLSYCGQAAKGLAVATFTGPGNSITATWTCNVPTPELSVSPTILNSDNGNCKLDEATGFYTCTVTLINSSDVLDLPWTASASGGATMQQTNGTIAAGGSVQVTITVNPCTEATPTVTFTGPDPNNSVTVTASLGCLK
jgi:hypothetical protein